MDFKLKASLGFRVLGYGVLTGQLSTTKGGGGGITILSYNYLLSYQLYHWGWNLHSRRLGVGGVFK